MAERVVVDQIDFRSALVFPRVLNSATGAFQPSRLLAATFIVLALAVFGRFYDALRGPMIQSAGLLSPTRSLIDSAVASGRGAAGGAGKFAARSAARWHGHARRSGY